MNKSKDRSLYLASYLFLLVGLISCSGCAGVEGSDNLSGNPVPDPAAASERVDFPTPPYPVKGDERTSSYKGVSFRYDSRLAESMVRRQIATYMPPNPAFLPNTFEPQHISFEFEGPYADSYSESFYHPNIKIYSIDEYKRLARAGGYGQLLKEKFDLLETTLRKRPVDIEGELPYIPWHDAYQAITAHKSYISFNHGTGIAYLTQFNHADPDLINNRKLIYVFQGITADKKRFIIATFPVRASFLPNDREATTYPGYDRPDDFYEPDRREENERGYDKYLLKIQKELEATAPEDFQPSLFLLDKMFASLDLQRKGR